MPKGLKALLYLGRRLDLKLPVLEAIIPSNEEQKRIALDMIAQTGKKRIGVVMLFQLGLKGDRRLLNQWFEKLRLEL